MGGYWGITVGMLGNRMEGVDVQPANHLLRHDNHWCTRVQVWGFH